MKKAFIAFLCGASLAVGSTRLAAQEARREPADVLVAAAVKKAAAEKKVVFVHSTASW